MLPWITHGSEPIKSSPVKIAWEVVHHMAIDPKFVTLPNHFPIPDFKIRGLGPQLMAES